MVVSRITKRLRTAIVACRQHAQWQTDSLQPPVFCSKPTPCYNDGYALVKRLLDIFTFAYVIR